MKINELLSLIGQKGKLNYFVICPDDLGLSNLLIGALASITAAEDIYFYDAESITVEKARQIEDEARTGARGGSELQVFFIHALQKINHASVGPLLKVVERAKYSRFIFQAQSTPQKIHTLMSRSSVIRLPFLTKRAVLATIQTMNRDAKTADEMNLYDGTLGGTLKALEMKDTIASIRRDMALGLKGIPSLFKEETLDSLAFEQATYDSFTDAELEFLGKEPDHDRKRIVLFLALSRI